MEPEDAFDAVHLQAAEEVDRFLADLEEGGRIDAAEARAVADIAYLFVEYLANTYPKLPRDATERDAWVFLFDYAITRGPFAGRTLEKAPKALAAFIEWVAARHPSREFPLIRAACRDEDFFVERLSSYRRMAAEAAKAPLDPERAADALDAWWGQLDERMRARGLAPDTALAGGSEVWGSEMGPIEAAVFDALCQILTAQARELAARRIEGEPLRAHLRKVQGAFMRAHNKGLGATPLEAVLAERRSLGLP